MSKSKKEKKISLKLRLLGIGLGPVLVLGVIVSAYAMKSMNQGMKQTLIEGQKKVAVSARAAYDAIDPGDYAVKDGDLYKGDFNITENEDIIDSLVEGTDGAITIFYNDTREATSLTDHETGERILGTKASADVVETVLKKGEPYESYDIVINGDEYYAYYLPIQNSDGTVVGMVFSGCKIEFLNTFIRQKQDAVFWVSAVMFLIFIITTSLAADSMAKVVKETQRALTQIAEGKLNVTLSKRSLNRTDEIGVMARDLQSMIDHLRKIITEITKSADILREAGVEMESMASQTSMTTDEVSRAVEEISKGAITQAEEIEQATHFVARMGEQIENIAANIGKLHDNSEQMERAKKEAETNMTLLHKSNEQTTDAIGKVSENVVKTDQSVAVISEALSMIADIADETNLLSLNASIEAARAGDAGRGFAVVAAQIQKLAEESNNSAAEIEEIIRTLSEDSQATLSVMEVLKENVIVQQDKLNDTQTKFTVVSDGILTSNAGTNQIHDQAEDCDASRVSMVDIIQNLSALSEENAASTEETNASMEELNATITLLANSAKNLEELAQKLEDEIHYFEV